MCFYLEVRGKWFTHYCPRVSSLTEKELVVLCWKGDMWPVWLMVARWLQQSTICDHVVASKLSSVSGWDFLCYTYLRVSCVDFILEKTIILFYEDHFKILHLKIFSLLWEESQIYSISMNKGKVEEIRLFLVKIFTLVYNRHFSLKQNCLPLMSQNV